MNTKRKRRYFYHDMANHLQVASRMSPEDGNASSPLHTATETQQSRACGFQPPDVDTYTDKMSGHKRPAG